MFIIDNTFIICISYILKDLYLHVICWLHCSVCDVYFILDPSRVQTLASLVSGHFPCSPCSALLCGVSCSERWLCCVIFQVWVLPLTGGFVCGIISEQWSLIQPRWRPGRLIRVAAPGLRASTMPGLCVFGTPFTPPDWLPESHACGFLLFASAV